MTRFSDAQPLYAEHGIVTFPVTQEKMPAVRGYLKLGSRASQELTLSKLGNAPAIGFATDRRNRIAVLDIDSTDERTLVDALDRHGHTPLVARTGSGTFHAYYRHNGERRKIRPWPGREIDLLGQGGMAVAPPSRVAKGTYDFIAGSLDDVSRLPVLRNLELPVARPAFGEPITEGRRNTELWRHCMRAGHHVDDFDALLDVARTFNEHQCQPPMEDREVIEAAQSAWNYTAKGRNWFGQHGVWMPKEEVNQMVNDQDAVFLLLFLRANQGPDATFMCANGLAEKFGWRRHRLSGARSRLIELGHMRSIRQAGRGHPALFRWAK